jgi:hypothetical protein
VVELFLPLLFLLKSIIIKLSPLYYKYYKFMAKNFLFFNAILFFTLLLFVFCPNYLLAEEKAEETQVRPQTATSPQNDEKTSSVTLPNPLEKDEVLSPQVLIGKIIDKVLGVVGSLALLMFIYGGFTWMLAGGNAEAVTKGKNILIWATIGLIVIFSSYALVKFVFSGIGAT